MTVESVQGTQVNMVWIGTLGSFVMVARPLELLFSVKFRLSHLEV